MGLLHNFFFRKSNARCDKKISSNFHFLIEVSTPTEKIWLIVPKFRYKYSPFSNYICTKKTQLFVPKFRYPQQRPFIIQ